MPHRFSQDYLRTLLATDAIKIAPNPEHPFILRNGSRSLIYIDHAEIICQPETYSPFIKALRSKIDSVRTSLKLSSSPILVNVDSKCSPQITGTLAWILGYRQIAVNSPQTTREEKGTKLQVRYPRNIQPGEHFFVIDDVYTAHDSTALNVIKKVKDPFKKNGLPFPLTFHIITGINRSTSQSVLSNEGDLITINSILTMREIVSAVENRLNESQREAFKKEFMPENHPGT